MYSATNKNASIRILSCITLSIASAKTDANPLSFTGKGTVKLSLGFSPVNLRLALFGRLCLQTMQVAGMDKVLWRDYVNIQQGRS